MHSSATLGCIFLRLQAGFSLDGFCDCHIGRAWSVSGRSSEILQWVDLAPALRHRPKVQAFCTYSTCRCGLVLCGVSVWSMCCGQRLGGLFQWVLSTGGESLITLPLKSVGAISVTSAVPSPFFFLFRSGYRILTCLLLQPLKQRCVGNACRIWV
jgi:hypothetical protein